MATGGRVKNKNPPLLYNLAELQKLSVEELRNQRYEKFRQIGKVMQEAAEEAPSAEWVKTLFSAPQYRKMLYW